MADHSYFEFWCLCGKHYQREQQETFTCGCGRLLVLNWYGDADHARPDAEAGRKPVANPAPSELLSLP